MTCCFILLKDAVLGGGVLISQLSVEFLENCEVHNHGDCCIKIVGPLCDYQIQHSILRLSQGKMVFQTIGEGYFQTDTGFVGLHYLERWNHTSSDVKHSMI